MRFNVIVKRSGCKKTEIVSEKNDYIEINVKGERKKGEANIEVIKFFTRLHKKPARIVKGFTSKRKVIEI